MEKRDKIYEGKAKIVYSTNDESMVIQHFKDDATAFNAEKKGMIVNKGMVNNEVSSKLFSVLKEGGIPIHLVEKLNDRDMLCLKLEIIPVEVVVRNIVAGSLSKRTGLAEGYVLKKPVMEFYLKDDALGDPMINESHIDVLELTQKENMADIKKYSYKVNDILKDYFDKRDIILVDFKLEFGLHKGDVYLGDEISPDTCRLWDKETKNKMDKDRFRRDLGEIEEAYNEVLKRVCDNLYET
jgi:phosphoribosylaminoimidazole-succinocarboxamide synthase